MLSTHVHTLSWRVWSLAHLLASTFLDTAGVLFLTGEGSELKRFGHD